MTDEERLAAVHAKYSEAELAAFLTAKVQTRGMTWAEWEAARDNSQFKDQGIKGKHGRGASLPNFKPKDNRQESQ